MADPTGRLSAVLDDEPMDTLAVARAIGAAPDTVRQWRHRGEGPPWYRAGRRIVRYRRTEVAAWLAAQDQGGEKVPA